MHGFGQAGQSARWSPPPSEETKSTNTSDVGSFPSFSLSSSPFPFSLPVVSFQRVTPCDSKSIGTAHQYLQLPTPDKRLRHHVGASSWPWLPSISSPPTNCYSGHYPDSMSPSPQDDVLELLDPRLREPITQNSGTWRDPGSDVPIPSQCLDDDVDQIVEVIDMHT
jgi:hypothetical protein